MSCVSAFNHATCAACHIATAGLPHTSYQFVRLLQTFRAQAMFACSLVGHFSALKVPQSLTSVPTLAVVAGDMEGKVMKYRRLDTDFVTTDPFTGLFLGAFGNQGPEVLQLRRQTDPDDVISVMQISVSACQAALPLC